MSPFNLARQTSVSGARSAVSRFLHVHHVMRYAPFIIVAAFLGLMLLTFIPAPQSAVELARTHGFAETDIARGQQFSFERRLFAWGATLLELAWLLVLVFGGWGRRITEQCRRLTGDRWLLTLLLAAACYFLVQTFISLPFDLGRFAHSTAWGMVDRPLSAWLVEYGMAAAVSAVVGGAVLAVFYCLLRWLPRWWWLAATLGSVGLAALFAMLWPIVVAPLFNTFSPIEQTKWAEWKKPLHHVIEKAGVAVEEILVMNASKQSKHTNAYFTGFGATRRIVIYDNLLDKHTLAEVESVLAHEIGHWHHDHIVKGIALGGLAMLVAFYLLARIMKWAEKSIGLGGPSDPAGLPLILLAGFIAQWAAQPLECAVSRHFERQADMMALKLAQQPDVFIGVEKKLVIDNLGNPAPAPWNVWLFSTHPPAVERIQMAQDWKREHPSTID